jgi:hypothetical protein
VPSTTLDLARLQQGCLDHDHNTRQPAAQAEQLLLAEDMSALNANVVGTIELVAEFHQALAA